MTSTKVTSLTRMQEKFFSLLSTFPHIETFWDRDSSEVNVDALQNAMGGMSHGERVTAAFMLSVWTGNNHQFDMIEAAACLDPEWRAVIVEWLRDPFWP